MPHKTFPAIALALLVLALTVGARPGAAQSQSPEATVDGLKGEAVAIFFGALPFSGKREVIQVHGKVNSASEHGLWLKPTRRYFKARGEERRGAALFMQFPG